MLACFYQSKTGWKLYHFLEKLFLDTKENYECKLLIRSFSFFLTSKQWKSLKSGEMLIPQLSNKMPNSETVEWVGKVFWIAFFCVREMPGILHPITCFHIPSRNCSKKRACRFERMATVKLDNKHMQLLMYSFLLI